MTEPAQQLATAPVQFVANTTSGANASRTNYPVTAATQAGDTLLASVAGNNSGAQLAVSGLTDSKGNQWVLDSTVSTASPGTYAFRCPGATGGPGGGPTAALATSDNLTVAMNGSVSAIVGVLAYAVTGVGALDPGQQQDSGAARLTQIAVTVTPSQPGDTLIAVASAQNAAGTLTADAPFTAGAQVTTQGVQLPAWVLSAGAAGTPVTCTVHGTASAAMRLSVWAFLPAVVPAGTVIQQPAPVHVRSLAGPVSVTLPNPTGSGNTLVVAVSTNGTTGNPLVSGITLGGGADNFAKVVQRASATRNNAEIWYDPSAAAGQTAVSVSFAGGTGTGDLYVQVWEVAGRLYPDQTTQAEASGPATSWSSGTSPPTQQASEILFGVTIATGTQTPTVTGAGTWTTQASAANTYAQVAGYQNVAATGTATYSGTTAGNSQNTTAVATFGFTATPALTGTGAISAKKIRLAGSGTFSIAPITGTAAIAVKKISLAGAGTFTLAPITGTGVIAAKKITLAGAGIFTLAGITGTGSVTAKKITLAGAGTFTLAGITGTGSITAKKITLAGTGTYLAPITGTGSVTAKKIALAGQGAFNVTPPAPPALLAAPPPTLIPVVWDGLSLNDGERDDGLCTVVTNVDGWYGSPPLVGNDLTRILTDGAIWGFKTVSARAITVTGCADGPRDLVVQFARALGARAVGSQPAELLIGEDTGDLDGDMMTLTAAVRADTDSLTHAWLSRTYFTYQVVLTAADPRLYQADVQTETLTPLAAGAVTGRTYPWTPARLYPGASLANTARLINPGSAPAPVTATYTGDLSETRLTDGLTGTVHLAPLSPSQVIIVDTGRLTAGTVGGVSRASYLLPGSTPLVIPPFGEVSWSVYGTGRGSVMLAWRGVWA